MAIEEFAPAKVNLTLHVTGRRADGYHLLDSLVVFAGVGDRVAATAADALSLHVTGPLAGAVPAGPDNLILKAASLFAQAPGARLVLDKHLPVASGIGGGSADAAAALRALARLWNRPLPGDGAVLALGADVPVCLAGRPAHMSGIGEVLGDPPVLPACWLVLVNPGVAAPTGAIFGALALRENAPMEPLPPRFADVGDLAAWLSRQRNDLEAAAIRAVPEIGQVLGEFQGAAGVLLARMSGSGATCYGLCASAEAAAGAARLIGVARPDWWVRAVPVLS